MSFGSKERTYRLVAIVNICVPIRAVQQRTLEVVQASMTIPSAKAQEKFEEQYSPGILGHFQLFRNPVPLIKT